MTTLSVVIPAWNEEDGIADIVNRVLAVRPKLAEVNVNDLELLVVDDGSSDSTRDIVREMEKTNDGLRLICHKQNGGYGAALKTGFREARGELIGFLDADGTYPPEFFPQLCKLALNGAQLVIGSRMAGADSQMPVTRRIGNIFFANLLSVLGRQKVTDSASGMRVFHKDILQTLSPLPDGLNLTPVMSTRAVHEDVQIREIPIPYSERVGRSKLSVVNDGFLFLNSMVWTVMKYNPVRLLGVLGLVGIAIGAAVVMWLVGARLSGLTTVGIPGITALFIGAILGFTGVSLLSLGITFNYLVALFHKRPVKQGLFGRPIFRNLDHHFGWLGISGVVVGIIMGIVALVFGFRGVEVGRLWLYLLGSGMLILTSVQLLTNWVLMRILDELNERDSVIARENEHSRVNVGTLVQG